MTDTAVEAKECLSCGARDRYPSGPCRPCTDRRNRERLEYRKTWAREKRLKDPQAVHAADKVRRDRRTDERKVESARWRLENPGYHRSWRADHRETTRSANQRWRAANPDKAKEATRRWRQANWPRVLNHMQQRRARRRAAAGRFTVAQARARFDYYGGRCWMCGAEATCMDHVVALCNGGSNWPSNLRPACGTCNGAKGQWEMGGPKPLRAILAKARDFKAGA